MSFRNSAASRRLRRLTAQACAGHTHLEGPLPEGEDSRKVLPDGNTPWRQMMPPSDGDGMKIDMEEIRAKYELEKNLRLDARPHGQEGLYVRVADLAKTDERFAAMLKDPFVEVPERAPITDEIEYAIVGAD